MTRVPRTEQTAHASHGRAHGPDGGLDVNDRAAALSVPRGVSVVIPNYNGGDALSRCLACLAVQTRPPREIIVVDNASTDGSLERSERAFPGATTLRLLRNHGFAGGVNRGVRMISGELVAVLNSDARPRPDWLELIAAAASDADDDVWAWGSVLLDSAGRIESAGDHWSESGFAFKHKRGDHPDSLADGPYPVFAPPGAAPVIRADRFRELGGYCEPFFLYYEDIDLAYRALLRGWTAVLVPTAHVEHDLGGSGSRARTRFYVARNSLWTAVRCSPDPSWVRLTHRAFCELRWKRRPVRLAAIELMGRLAGLRGLRPRLRERQRIQASRTLDSSQVRTVLELLTPAK